MRENKKWFEEPEVDVVKLQISDVITRSDLIEDGEDPDWGMGDF